MKQIGKQQKKSWNGGLIRRSNMKAGDKIRVVCMDGEPQYTGKEGTVTHIDDAGQIHGTWGGCALIPGVDQYEVIK